MGMRATEFLCLGFFMEVCKSSSSQNPSVRGF